MPVFHDFFYSLPINKKVTLSFDVLAECIDCNSKVLIPLARSFERSGKVAMDSPHDFRDHMDRLQGRYVLRPCSAILMSTTDAFLHSNTDVLLPTVPPITCHNFLNCLVSPRVFVEVVKNFILLVLLNHPFSLSREVTIGYFKLSAYGQKVASSAWVLLRVHSMHFVSQYLAV